MKKVLWLFISILASYSIWAQETTKTTLENSLLWEITGNELDKPSYLYGTIHMIGKDDYFLTDATKKAFDQSEKVAFEINMEDMMDFTKIMPLMMKAFMPDGVTLSSLLTEEEYKLVKDHFESIGLPLFMVERIKPMFLSMMAQGDMLSMDPQSDSGDIVSYEMEFMSMAQEKGKPIDGLETAEFQMSMISDSIPYDVQAKMLIESIQLEDTDADQFDEMVKLYKSQDIEAMQSLMDEDEGIGDYGDLLLVSRNENWIPIMAEMMAQQPTFFAVGAGHLGGAKGVVTLLREKGYTLTPMR
jgi:uncharacterized protein YbaP (TraB family)